MSEHTKHQRQFGINVYSTITVSTMFKGRFGVDGCRKVGWIRVALAFLFIVDRLLLGMDLDKFFSPIDGMAPYAKVDHSAHTHRYQWSLIALAPESRAFLWFLYYLGLCHGFALMLGIAPRLNLLLVFVHFRSFKNITPLFFDGEDEMINMYMFYMLFLPLHHITIYDWFGAKRSVTRANDTWPICWVWLLKFQIMIIYAGAAGGKFRGSMWKDGTAMYHISHMLTGEFGGCFTPDFLFNYMAPMKLMTWGALFIECTTPFLIWFPKFRLLAFSLVVALHLGIEITMTMHIFEYLTVLGWCFFFVVQDVESTNKVSTPLWRRLLDGTTVGVLLLSASCMGLPWSMVPELFPSWISSPLNPLVESVTKTTEHQIIPYAQILGNHQYSWDMVRQETRFVLLFTTSSSDRFVCNSSLLQFDGSSFGGGVQYSVEGTLRNGTSVLWYMPFYPNMTWLERKREMRMINFYSNFRHYDGANEPVLFMEYILEHEFAEWKNDVQYLTVWAEAFYVEDPPEDVGLWEPVRYRELLSEGNRFDSRLMVCSDQLPPECKDWAKHGLCMEEERYMADRCPLACGFCTSHWVLNSIDDPTNWLQMHAETDEMPCVNYDDECDDWADRYECVSNARFMHKVCPLACDLCEEDSDEEEGEDPFSVDGEEEGARFREGRGIESDDEESFAGYEL